jgi:hypothetical protein
LPAGHQLLRQRQGQRVLRKANQSHRAAAASVAPKRVQMVLSKAGSLAKCCLGVSSVNQKWRMD